MHSASKDRLEGHESDSYRNGDPHILEVSIEHLKWSAFTGRITLHVTYFNFRPFFFFMIGRNFMEEILSRQTSQTIKCPENQEEAILCFCVIKTWCCFNILISGGCTLFKSSIHVVESYSRRTTRWYLARVRRKQEITELTNRIILKTLITVKLTKHHGKIINIKRKRNNKSLSTSTIHVIIKTNWAQTGKCLCVSWIPKCCVGLEILIQKVLIMRAIPQEATKYPNLFLWKWLFHELIRTRIYPQRTFCILYIK